MPNDAKLGLVVGVALVITVAVVFFRQDLITRTPGEPAPTSTLGPRKPHASTAPAAKGRPTPARTASQTVEKVDGGHLIEGSETLESGRSSTLR